MGLPLKKQLQQGLTFLAIGFYAPNQIAVPIAHSYVNANYQTNTILDINVHKEMNPNLTLLEAISEIRDTAHRNETEYSYCNDFATYVYDELIEYATLNNRKDILDSIRLVSGRVKDDNGWTDHMWIDIKRNEEWEMFDTIVYIPDFGLEYALQFYPNKISIARTQEGSRKPSFYISKNHFDAINTGLLAHIANTSNEGSESLTNIIASYLGW